MGISLVGGWMSEAGVEEENLKQAQVQKYNAVLRWAVADAAAVERNAGMLNVSGCEWCVDSKDCGCRGPVVCRGTSAGSVGARWSQEVKVGIDKDRQAPRCGLASFW